MFFVLNIISLSKHISTFKRTLSFQKKYLDKFSQKNIDKFSKKNIWTNLLKNILTNKAGSSLAGWLARLAPHWLMSKGR